MGMMLKRLNMKYLINILFLKRRGGVIYAVMALKTDLIYADALMPDIVTQGRFELVTWGRLFKSHC